MAGPELTFIQKYEQFRNSNPQYKDMGVAQLCSIMVEQKMFTQAEVNELFKSYFQQYKSKPNTLDYTSGEIWGINIADKPNSTTFPTNCVELPTIYHDKVKSLPLLPSGKVDLNKFTFRELKETYPSDKYSVTKNQDGMILVSDLQGNVVLNVSNNFLGYNIEFVVSPTKFQTVFVDKLGEVGNYSTTEIVGDVKTVNIYDNKGKYPKQTNINNSEGYYRINRDSKTGKFELQDFWEKGASYPTWSIEYTDGKPYKKVENGKAQYILVEDLEKDITSKNKLGLPTTRKSISDNVLKRITSDNVVEVFEEYEKATGRDLIQDIKDEIGLASEHRDKLINHIETLYCKKAPGKASGKYLAKKLFDDIQGLGSGKLKEHLKMIDSRNLKYVLSYYRNLSAVEHFSTIDNVDMVTSYIDYKFGIDLDKSIAKIISPFEGLLVAISKEYGLSEKTRQNLIKQIINTTLDDKILSVQKRIGKDIDSHSEDYHKIEVDLYRADNATFGEFRNPDLNMPKDKVSLNKTFNGQIKQGQTGDCWLLAALNSVIAKPQFLAKLEDAVVYDSKNGDYVVKMKYPKMEYRITQEDLKNYTALSTGSEKVNAVEIAMDRLIRDKAYNDEDEIFTIDEDNDYVHFVTIDANWPKYLWRSLFGLESLVYGSINPTVEDFNNPNRVYAMFLGEDNLENISAKSQKDPNYTFVGDHAYSIIGSDETNIYITNPWDSTDIVTISRQEFKKLGAHIEAYDLPIS